MSGSPILQNGRLVGAVTHVLVNDPTRGYGIFAQTMLEQAQQAAKQITQPEKPLYAKNKRLVRFSLPKFAIKTVELYGKIW